MKISGLQAEKKALHRCNLYPKNKKQAPQMIQQYSEKVSTSHETVFWRLLIN
jgi:hypothetical protein